MTLPGSALSRPAATVPWAVPPTQAVAVNAKVAANGTLSRKVEFAAP